MTGDGDGRAVVLKKGTLPGYMVAQTWFVTRYGLECELRAGSNHPTTMSPHNERAELPI